MLANRILKLATRPVGWPSLVAALALCAVAWTAAFMGVFDGVPPRSYVGPDHFKTAGQREFLLATDAPNDDEKEWFEITNSPLDKDGYQYGIGKDTIPSIDDPVFVDPDDQRLLALNRTNIDTNDDLQVIGYAADGLARAYPVGLLDHHELVNDTFAGKPITVGW